jgi:hypothetical protein
MLKNMIRTIVNTIERMCSTCLCLSLVNNRPRIIDDRLKQLQPQQNKSSKMLTAKSANDDLKKLIQERRKAAATGTNQNHDIEIFVGPK